MKTRRRPAPRSTVPYRAIETVLAFLLLVFVLLAVISWLQKDRLPDPSFYDQQQLGEPKQVGIEMPPFETEVNGIVYTISPQFAYDLRGIVVSQYLADSIGDIYHHDRWQDFLNIKDLCVVWGNNVASGVYQDMDFDNGPWVCRYFWPDARVRARFLDRELSNNHLLTNDPEVNEAIMSAEPGDQIHFIGVLASYSHSNNSFQRGTSISRTDRGNGACETVFVARFEVTKKANTGWRRLYSVSKWAAILTLAALVVLFFVSPVRRSA